MPSSGPIPLRSRPACCQAVIGSVRKSSGKTAQFSENIPLYRWTVKEHSSGRYKLKGVIFRLNPSTDIACVYDLKSTCSGNANDTSFHTSSSSFVIVFNTATTTRSGLLAEKSCSARDHVVTGQAITSVSQ